MRTTINRRQDRRAAGFTIIEILVAMTVLSIIVLLMGDLFEQASKAWTDGEKQVSLNDLGRAIMDEVYLDLVTAIADDLVPFEKLGNQALDNGYWETPGSGTAGVLGPCDAIYSVAGIAHRGGNPDRLRDFSEVHYYVEVDDQGRGVLMRRRATLGGEAPPMKEFRNGVRSKLSEIFKLASDDVYANVVAQNVYSFQVTCQAPDGSWPVDYDMKKVGGPDDLPNRIDIRLVLLSDEAWARTNTYAGDLQAWEGFVQTNKVEFAMSAAFPNKGR